MLTTHLRLKSLLKMKKIDIDPLIQA